MKNERLRDVKRLALVCLGAAVMAVECSLIAYFIQIDHGDYLRGSLELFALMNDANLMDTVL